LSSFDDDFSAAAVADLLEVYGESVTIYPKLGAARTVSAIIDRNPPARMSSGGQMVTPRLGVELLDSSTLGLSSAEAQGNGNDRIRVDPRTPGGTNLQTLGLYLPGGGDGGDWCGGGMITLEAM